MVFIFNQVNFLYLSIIFIKYPCFCNKVLRESFLNLGNFPKLDHFDGIKDFSLIGSIDLSEGFIGIFSLIIQSDLIF